MRRSSLEPRERTRPIASTSPTIQRKASTPEGRSQPPPARPGDRFDHDFSAIPVHGRAPIGIQTKLSVNTPGDRYEREADRLASMVMGMPAPHGAGDAPTTRTEEGAIQTKPSFDRSPGMARARGSLESRLTTGKRSGSPLPGDVRGFMESRFGTDLGHVRVHTGTEAAGMNRSLGAQAFTHSRDIYYGAGKGPGRDMLTAHELTHVLQQTGGATRNEASPRETTGTPAIQRTVELRPPGKGEASAFDRRQELVDRLNAQSAAIQYDLVGGDRMLHYNVIDESALRDFDRRMMKFIDDAPLVPLRLITSAGRAQGRADGPFLPIVADYFPSGYVDLDDLLATDDLAFQSILLHFLTERARTKDYARRIGTPSLDIRSNPAPFRAGHRAGHDAQAEHFQDIFGDPSIRYNYEEGKPYGTAHIVFQSRDRGYWIFLIVHNIRGELSRSEVKVRTTDRRWMTVPDFLAEQAAAVPDE